MTTHTFLPDLSNGATLASADWNAWCHDNMAITPAALTTQSGDFYASSGSLAANVLAPGSSGQIVETDSTTTTGLKNSWGFIPVGGIIMWSGALGSLPSNWQLCDGTNGTPNLTSKFIIGAGGSYGVGDTGGVATADIAHVHNTKRSHDAGTHTHTQANTLGGSAHTHTDTLLTSSSYNSMVSGSLLIMATPGHTHTYTTQAESSHAHANPSTSENLGHTHTLFLASQLSGSQDILPPYYTLAFIRRMS